MAGSAEKKTEDKGRSVTVEVGRNGDKHTVTVDIKKGTMFVAGYNLEGNELELNELALKTIEGMQVRLANRGTLTNKELGYSKLLFTKVIEPAGLFDPKAERTFTCSVFGCNNKFEATRESMYGMVPKCDDHGGSN